MFVPYVVDSCLIVNQYHKNSHMLLSYTLAPISPIFTIFYTLPLHDLPYLWIKYVKCELSATTHLKLISITMMVSYLTRIHKLLSG